MTKKQIQEFVEGGYRQGHSLSLQVKQRLNRIADVIQFILKQRGIVSVADIQKFMGVAYVTAVRLVADMQRYGLVTSEKVRNDDNRVVRALYVVSDGASAAPAAESKPRAAAGRAKAKAKKSAAPAKPKAKSKPKAKASAAKPKAKAKAKGGRAAKKKRR